MVRVQLSLWNMMNYINVVVIDMRLRKEAGDSLLGILMCGTCCMVRFA